MLSCTSNILLSTNVHGTGTQEPPQELNTDVFVDLYVSQ